MSQHPQEQNMLWGTFARAIGAEPREATEIQGASGLMHRVQSIAVDDSTKRIVIVSAEASPRIAALMQSDIQASIPDAHVLVARPIAMDLSAMARGVAAVLGDNKLTKESLGRFNDMAQSDSAGLEDLKKEMANLVAPIQDVFSRVSLPPLDQIMAFLQQAALLDWPEMLGRLQNAESDFVLSLEGLLQRDMMAQDRAFGVCPFPLYEMNPDDWDAFLAGRSAEEIRERLRRLGILQYFFPPSDQLALGVIDRGLSKRADITSVLKEAPTQGHPLSAPELLRPDRLPQLIEDLASQGYVVEGEYGFETTARGTKERGLIKFRPREGAITKLLNRIRLSAKLEARISSKDLFGG